MSQYLIPEQLKRDSATPLYSQIYEQLKRDLVLGKYQAGDRFYSYRKLKEIYKAELRTIAAAVDLLIADRLVEKRIGCGVYVTGVKNVSEVGNLWYAVLTYQHYHPFYYNILVGLINEAEQFGLRVVVCMGKSREDFLRWFVPRPGEGLIITGNVDDELLKAAGKKCKDNLVVVGNYELNGKYGQVTTNFEPQLLDALELAVKHGCKRPALIIRPGKLNISRALKRIMTGFMEKHGLQTEIVEEEREDGYRAMSRLETFKPDCILLTEPAFSGAWEYMLEHSLRCPEDIFLIRYGKECNDNTFAGKAAVELEDNSVIHGKTALHMLLNNSKEITAVDIEMRCKEKEKKHAIRSHS